MLETITKLIEDTDNGDLEILNTFVELREKKKTLEYLIDKIKDFEKRYITEIESQASDYPEGFKGHDIKLVSGRQTMSFKNLPEWNKAEENKKFIEGKYKAWFNVYQKTNERPMSEDGVIHDLPEVKYSASYFKVTQTKKKP